MLVITTILWLFVLLLTLLIWWRGWTVRVLTVSYAVSLMLKLLDNLPLPFSFSINIGSVVLTYYISIGAILAFDLHPISSPFSLFEIWLPKSQAWWFVPMSGSERGRRCVFLKYLWVIVVDDSLKDSHVSTRTEFMWGGINLRVTWWLIKFIIESLHHLLILMFGSLSFGW